MDLKGGAMEKAIRDSCDELADWLIEKNKAYGNSAIHPVNIFSKCSAIDQINNRIDDKLSRLMHGQEYPGDDTEKDLLGYLILKRVVKRKLVLDAAEQISIVPGHKYGQEHIKQGKKTPEERPGWGRDDLPTTKNLLNAMEKCDHDWVDLCDETGNFECRKCGKIARYLSP
ncbi:MAG: hypothetical protein GY841_15995 [FCB group bacterium]|nr:hypothetical protein [FCB group bacterium]